MPLDLPAVAPGPPGSETRRPAEPEPEPEGRRAGFSSVDLARLVVRGGAWSLAISVTGAVVSLGVHLLLARTLGAQEYGRYVFALAWMNVLVLVGKFDLDTAAVRFVGAYSGTEQWAFLRGFLRRSGQIVSIASTSIALLGAIGVLLFIDQVDRATAYSFLAACLLLPLMALLQLKASIVQGLKHVAGAQAPMLLVRPLLFAGGFFGMWYLADRGLGATEAILVQCAATVVALWLTARFLKGVLPEPVRRAGEAFDTRYWMRTAAGLLIISGAQLVLSANADVLVVGSLLGTGAAGRYGAASQLASAVSFGVSAISFIALPIIADLHARQKLPDLQRLITHVARLGLTLSVPVLLLLIVAAAPLLRAFGPTFTDAAPLLVLLAFEQLVAAVFGIAGYLLVMTGHQVTAARVVIASAVLNLALTFILTLRFGLLGAGVATALATVVRSVLMTERMRALLGLSLAPWHRVRAAD